MKRNLLQPLWKFLLLISILTFTTREGWAQVGSACANPIPLGDVSYAGNLNLTGNELWFSITAVANSHHFQLDNLDTINGYVTDFAVFSSTCSASPLFSTTVNPNKKQVLSILASGLTPGATYNIRVKRSGPNPSTALFDLMREDWNTSSASCSPPCNLVCNGSFEDFDAGPPGDCLNCIAGGNFQQFDLSLNSHCWRGLGLMEQYALVGTCSPDYINTCAPTQCSSFYPPVPHSCNGVASLYCMGYAGQNPNNLYREFIYQPNINVPAAGIYQVSFWVKRVFNGPDAPIGFFLTQNNLTSYNFSVSQVPSYATTIASSNHSWTKITGYVTVTTAGSYNLAIGIFDNSSTNYFDAFFYIDDVVMQPNPPQITVAPNPICSQNYLNLYASAGATSYQWTVSPSIPGFPLTGSIVSLPPPLPAGYYTVTLTTGGPNGCTVQDFPIHILPGPTAHIPGPSTIELCAGQSTVLNATTTLPAGIQWYASPNANGQGSQSQNCSGCSNFTVSASGYYYFVVTDPVTGCTTFSNVVHVIVHPNPLVAILAAADENCPAANDGSILCGVTSGTAPYSYSWNTTPVQTTALASGLNSGTYTVTVTDANGCVGQASASVGAIPLPPLPTITASSANLCSSPVITYTITNYDASIVYTTSYSTTPISVTQPSAGVYMVDWGQSGSDVTFTVTADAGSGNPVCLQTASIMVPACCGIYGFDDDALMTGLPGSKTAYDLYNNYPAYVTGTAANFTYNNANGILYINGDFIVPSNCSMTIDASQVRFGADAAIYLMSNAYLMISNSHLAAGCNNMWDGMYINPTAQLFTQKSSLIEDAKHAVVSVGGGYYNLQETTFNKNRIGVDVMNYNNAHPGFITNCVFTCRDLPGNTTIANVKGNQNTSVFIQDYPVSTYAPAGMLPPYNKQRSWTGVYCNSVGNTSIGANYQVSSFGALTVGDPANGYNGLNVFDNLDYGVYAHYSNIVVKNNAFQYITGPATVSKGGQLYGIAVYGETFSEQDNEWVAHVGDINADHNTFYECGRGVDLNGYYDNVVTGNFFESRQVYSPVQSSVLPPTGSHAIFIKTGYYINVDASHNDIVNWANGIVFYSDYLSAGPGHYYQLQGDATITHNRISPMEADNLTPTTEYVSTAIVAQNIIPGCNQCTGTSILGRLYVDNNGLNNVFNGIVMQSWLKAPRAADNIISLRYQAPYQLFKFPQTGIRSVSNVDDVIYRNTITGDTQVLTKTLARGIYSTLSQGGQVRCNIITNVGQCIVFEDNCIPTTFVANEMNASIDGYVLLNNGKIGPQGCYANAAFPNGQTCDNLWYGPFSHAATFTDNTYAPDQHSPLYVRGNSNAAYIPTPNLTTSLFPIFDSYIAPNSINVVMTPAPLTDCSQAPQLAEGGGTANTDEKIKVMEKIAQSAVENGGYAEQSDFADQKSTYLALRSDSTLMDTSTVLQDFYSTTTATSAGQLVLADEMLAGNDLASGAGLTAAVITTTLADENLKTVNGLFAMAADGQPLSEAQLAQLETIAAQCATEGGEGVYRARALLAVLNNNYVQYEDTCLPPPNSQRHAHSASPAGNVNPRLNVFPNPSSGSVNIAGELQSQQPVYFELRDLAGRVILRKPLTAGNQLWTVDLSTLSAGTYQYTIGTENNTFQAERIVITQ